MTGCRSSDQSWHEPCMDNTAVPETLSHMRCGWEKATAKIRRGDSREDVKLTPDG